MRPGCALYCVVFFFVMSCVGCIVCGFVSCCVVLCRDVLVQSASV